MNLIYSDRTRVWDTKDPVYTQIGLEKLERKYNGKGLPLDAWEATLTAFVPSDIQILLDFKPDIDLEVKHIIQGRPDVYKNGSPVVMLYHCVPILGWYDDLVKPVDQKLVTYRLIVSCQVKHDLSTLIYY